MSRGRNIQGVMYLQNHVMYYLLDETTTWGFPRDGVVWAKLWRVLRAQAITMWPSPSRVLSLHASYRHQNIFQSIHASRHYWQFQVQLNGMETNNSGFQSNRNGVLPKKGIEITKIHWFDFEKSVASSLIHGSHQCCWLLPTKLQNDVARIVNSWSIGDLSDKITKPTSLFIIGSTLSNINDLIF